MNNISGVLPCFRGGTCSFPSQVNLGSLISKVVSVVVYVFSAIANAALSLFSMAVKSVKWTVNLILGSVCCCDCSGPYMGKVLNSAALNRAPLPLDLDELARHGALIDISHIVAEYRAVFGQQARDSDVNFLNGLVELANRQGNSDYDRLYYSTLKKLLQNIIIELRKPDNEIEKKQRALAAIIEAQGRCTPRRLAECERQYKLLKTGNPEMEQLLLEYVQDLKEEILIEGFQSAQFHVINYIRSRVGRELGLNTSRLNLEDPHLRAGGTPSDTTIRNVFYAEYTPENVVEGVMTRIHLERNGDVCSAYIHQELREQAHRRGEDPNDDEISQRILDQGVSFFNGHLINQAGVVFLLESIGILIPA